MIARGRFCLHNLIAPGRQIADPDPAVRISDEILLESIAVGVQNFKAGSGKWGPLFVHFQDGETPLIACMDTRIHHDVLGLG